MRLFLGVEQGFFLARLGVALGVLDDAERLLFGAADGFGGDALAVGDPDREHRAGGHERDDDVDEHTDISATRVTSFPVTHVGLELGRRRARGISPADHEQEEGAMKGPALPCGEVDEPA